MSWRQMYDSSRWAMVHLGRELLEIEKRNHTHDASGSFNSGNGSGQSEIEAEKGIFWAKLFVSLFVTVEIILFGLLPAFGGRFIHVSDRVKTLFVGISNAFAGGVFLGGALVHLLGEAAETFASLYPENENATAIVCTFSGIGYMLVFFVERVLLASHHGAHSHDLNGGGHGHDHKKKSKKKHDANGDHHHHHHHQDEESQDAALVENDSIDTKSSSAQSESTGIEMETYQTSSPPVSDPIRVIEPKTSSGEKQESDNDEDEHSKVASFALTAVLFLHTFISGLALSLQTSLKTIAGLALAIALHKWIEAFALGISMHRLLVPIKRRIILIVFYSLATPVGMLLGSVLAIAFIHTDELMQVTEAIGGAVASGTFLYVAAVDVLAEEFADQQNKWIKAFSCVLGFGFMTLLKFSMG
eukprot:TRINITY_DN263_c1_g1_i1.p1 TRINITY_DN263_c1_g1~~TRINITY_DN263_c1_g1_i1.p1  ORF type:complete len:415 (+),score=98.66 TRINITY_DN263_c1_g1_i1:271-1515(+)